MSSSYFAQPPPPSRPFRTLSPGLPSLGISPQESSWKQPPPPLVYYGNSFRPPAPHASSSSSSFPPILTPGADNQPSLSPPSPDHERLRPSMSLNLPQPPTFANSQESLPSLHWANDDHQTYGAQTSPYPYPKQSGGWYPSQSDWQTPSWEQPQSADSAGSMTEYFPPYSTHSTPSHASQSLGHPMISPPYPGVPSQRPLGPHRTQSHSVVGGTKTGRQQFSACGACRHRRVKCDLKEKQDILERENMEEDQRGYGLMRAPKIRKKATCSNCEERGVACIDEYAPLKAAKQLRRGKRISEIELLYGKSAANAAMADNDEPETSRMTMKGKDKATFPELTKDFFDSAFFRRFHVQRPVLDPQDFTQRYLSATHPCAAAMGPEGAILCHVLYAWALSYGVDENGQLDIPEGGGNTLGPLPLGSPSENELKREADRHKRFMRMKVVIEVILREIDECGVMRRPTWDGVRVLLLVLPLTEGISPSVERLAMYETALNQVYSLCSFSGVGYDGQPSATSAVNGGSDGDGSQNVQLVRVRIYWYAFVHEGITSGLKGGRLLLDEEDLDTMQDSIHNRALIISSSSFRTTIKFATAPINLALACRKINRALTGPRARRNRSVNGTLVKEAWEALEASWEEFDALKYSSDAGAVYSSMDEVVRFADGWKIFLFEAQNVVRKILEERLSALQAEKDEAHITSNTTSPSDADTERQTELLNVQRLLDISRSKCEVQCRQIMDMVRKHVGSRFFEWDASLVRDGTFYAAKLLPRQGGTEDDIATCLQALNELRWAHAKAWDRSAELRQEWADSRSNISPNNRPNIAPNTWDNSKYLPPIQSGSTDKSVPLPSGHDLSLKPTTSNNSGAGQASPFQSTAGFPSPGFPSPGFLPNRDQLQSFGGLNMDAPRHQQYSAAADDNFSERTGQASQQMQPMQPLPPMQPLQPESIASNTSAFVYGHMPGPPPLGGGGGGGTNMGVQVLAGAPDYGMEDEGGPEYGYSGM